MIAKKRRGFNLFKFLNAGILAVGVANGSLAQDVGISKPVASITTSASQVSEVIPQGQRDLIDALSLATRLAIGAAELERLRAFQRFEAGWDGDGSKELQLSSVKLFDRFMRDTGIRPPGASVFMSSYGELILAWQDKDLNTTELKFMRGGIEYFNEADGMHCIVPPRKFVNLVEMLRVPQYLADTMQLAFDFSSGSSVVASKTHRPFQMTSAQPAANIWSTPNALTLNENSSNSLVELLLST